jgi:hypothetical protein
MDKGGAEAGEAPAGEKAMALLLRPVRHAVNNLSMVMNANLEAAMPQLKEGERVTRQIARAQEAALAYDALVRGFLSLGREEGMKGMMAGRFIQELLPLLSLAAGSALELQGAASNAVVQRRSPALEGALILAAASARAVATAPLPPLRLEGARLSMDWAMPADATRALASAGAVVEQSETGVVIALPQG